jgi:predicted dehydrogenase
MILQKCCHDMDLLQYFVGAKCKSVSSMGSLAFFKQENAPTDCAKRCLDCKYVNDCFYSAKRVYIDKWKRDGQPENAWPMNSITNVLPLTEKVLYDALKEGPFGRCVFYCDNNVVDNQVVCMQFENGVTATLKMQAFTKYGGRDITFFGSKGQLVLSEAEGTITLKKYWTEDKTWRLNELTDDLAGHGGGDHRMMDRLYDAITCSDSNIDTDIDNSVESHYMSLAAEQSRMEGGKLIQLKDYR